MVQITLKITPTRNEVTVWRKQIGWANCLSDVFKYSKTLKASVILLIFFFFYELSALANLSINYLLYKTESKQFSSIKFKWVSFSLNHFQPMNVCIYYYLVVLKQSNTNQINNQYRSYKDRHGE